MQDAALMLWYTIAYGERRWAHHGKLDSEDRSIFLFLRRSAQENLN